VLYVMVTIERFHVLKCGQVACVARLLVKNVSDL
jgi:hypothetical protein